MTDLQVELEADLRALNTLVVDCPELEKLESLLGSFNIFQVLRSELGELKHSNVLAWLLDPSESHGLGAVFLKKWLMRVLHESPGAAHAGLSPVDIDSWSLMKAKVHREWNYIDVLLILKMHDGNSWIVCIENKVNASQGPGQLKGYREMVAQEFSSASHCLYLFLTKNCEKAADPHYIPASYSQIHCALQESVHQRRLSIGTEPRVLIENYLRLLEEKFMNESEIAKTVLSIYRTHGRALKVILANHPDNIRHMIARRVAQLLRESSSTLQMGIELCDDWFVRFIPNRWNQPGNLHGRAWRGFSTQVLFEVDFNDSMPKLLIVSGGAPELWEKEMVKVACAEPFKTIQHYERPLGFPALHAEELGISVAADDVLDPWETAKQLFARIQTRLKEEDIQMMIRIIADQFPSLDQLQLSQQP